MFNRFQTIIPMNAGELAENGNICDLYFSKLNEVRKLGVSEEELRLNNLIYEKVFERYIRASKQYKEKLKTQLHLLEIDAQKLMIQLNHWEETA